MLCCRARIKALINNLGDGMGNESKDKIDFQLAQILGSSAIEGSVTTEETKGLLVQVLEGSLSVDAAKQALINRYREPDAKL